MSFFGELKRRNVFRVGVAYLLAAWVLLQIVDFVLDAISAPNWVVQVFILAAAVGLPVVLIFSWVFEMTPEGVKREREIDRSQSITPNTGRKLDRVIILFLVAAVALLLADRFIGAERVTTETAAATPAAEHFEETVGGRHAAESVVNSEKSVAVLPFLSLSSGQDDEYFADGLTEEILNSLAQLPELLVTARTSSFHFKGRDVPIQEIASQLGVGTIVEGSVRRSGERLRVTAQLIRAADGFHLWSENYDSTSEDTIAVQEDIAVKIATAMNVVLDEDKREAMRRAGLRNVEAFIAMQKATELFEIAHGDADIIGGLEEANRYFDQVLQLSPDNPSWAYQGHSDLYIHKLLRGANGETGGVTDPAEVEDAMSAALADYEQELRSARTPQERNNAELDLAYITGNWAGMPARFERYAAEKGCSEGNWMQSIALPFGYASTIAPRSREFVVCDPMSSSTWRGEVRALLWSGEPEAALQSAQKGSELAPGEWLSMQLVSALAALGQFEEADSEVTARVQNDFQSSTARIMIAAARGDQEQMNTLIEQRLEYPDLGDFRALNYFAWAGDRDRANEVAARIDQHAMGSQALSTALLWCYCGAAFDLEATPNFAENIRESGLVWPPDSPIEFPFKNW
jgi:TolB-like protein